MPPPTSGIRRYHNPQPSRRLGLAGVLLLVSPAFGGRAAESPFYEPREHYYKAHGVGVVAAWTVDRTTVPEDAELTATLTIRNVVNPREIVRPNLRGLSAFKDRFQIEDVPAAPPAADAKEVAFAYHLRPRDRAVDRVPSLPFAYVNPHAPEAKRFMKTTAAGIDITVTPAAPKVVHQPAVPLDAPGQLLTITTGPKVLEQERFGLVPWVWLIPLLIGPLAASAWYLAWRVKFPDAARLARAGRTRAARQAVAAVRRAHRTADPAAATFSAVHGYLRARFLLPTGADTPSEVAAALRIAGLSVGTAEEVARFFRHCDEVRFAGVSDSGPSLGSAAAALIARLEAGE